MGLRWRHKSVIWMIVISVIVTLIGVALAMNFATPHKKLKQILEHTYAITDPQFRREMGVLLGPTVLPGNKVTDLENGDQIFPAMLAAIRSAQNTVTFETYIYWSGDIGKQFGAAFSERACAGVKVHITLDWHGSSKLDKSALEEMKQAGVNVEIYRPLAWYNVTRLNKRTHRKLLIVDGRIGFTGGVGIADSWEGHAQDPDHWRDIHFRVEGPVVAQMQSAFDDNCVKTSGKLLNGAGFYPEIATAGSMDASMFMSSPSGGSASMHLMYLMVIAATEHQIDLSAAYFVPDELMIQSLLAARKRGVKVRVLLPGKHSDSEAVRLASKAEWGRLLSAGVEMFVYQPTMIHNKMLIADNELVSVGSTNFDIRSFQLNDEASLNVYDKTFASHMTSVYEDDLRNATPYTYAMWKQRTWKEKLGEILILPIKSQL